LHADTGLALVLQKTWNEKHPSMNLIFLRMCLWPFRSSADTKAA
jgi:hypothetical protein